MPSPIGCTITGLVLAAGRSERMGRPKPLLLIEGRTLVSLAASALREGGCSGVAIVVAEDMPAVRDAAASCGRVIVAPADPAAEPIDSIRLAAATMPDTDGLLILPVDCPFVDRETVASLIARFSRGDTAAVVPAYGGEPGHPVLLGRALLGRLGETLPEGLRSLLLAGDPMVLEVDDAAVLADLDTPADARAWGIA